MYTDKINPDHPEGRLLISNRAFHLKDQSIPISSVPLSRKAQTMFKHLEGKNFEEGSKLRMHKAYSAICEASAYRNVNKYSEILRRMPSEQKFLSWWLLFDFYDMLPDGCRINSNSAYYRLSPYYRDIIDGGMKAGVEGHLRDVTVSVEASMTAPFFEYLQDMGIGRLRCLTEKAVRDFTRSGRCKPLALYRMSLFLRRYAEKNQDEDILSVLHFFPKERLDRKIYEAFTHTDVDGNVDFPQIVFEKGATERGFQR